MELQLEANPVAIADVGNELATMVQESSTLTKIKKVRQPRKKENKRHAQIPKEGDETTWSGVTTKNISWNVHFGDAVSVLKSLPSKTFDCVVTSPPYFWLRDYSVDNQIGQEPTIEGYVSNIANVMNEVYRVLKPGGVVFLNIGDTYYSGKGESKGKDKKNRKRRFGPRAVDESGGLSIGLQRKSLIGVPWRVAIDLSQRKWVLRSSIVWVNNLRTPETVKDRPRQEYEYIFMLVKRQKYYFNREALEKLGDENVWQTTSRPKIPKGIETAPFPDDLVQRCLDIGCPSNGAVLDPFAGSGTTLRVALKSGRSATGVELNPTTCAYILKQVGKL